MTVEATVEAAGVATAEAMVTVGAMTVGHLRQCKTMAGGRCQRVVDRLTTAADWEVTTALPATSVAIMGAGLVAVVARSRLRRSNGSSQIWTAKRAAAIPALLSILKCMT
jgi:type IV secretory pathway ATPase VirB11/archaellum biosynthesis ATPase